MGLTLRHWATGCYIGAGKIIEHINCSCIMAGERDLGGTLPMLLECKDDGGRIVLSELQDSINIALQ